MGHRIFLTSAIVLLGITLISCSALNTISAGSINTPIEIREIDGVKMTQLNVQDRQDGIRISGKIKLQYNRMRNVQDHIDIAIMSDDGSVLNLGRGADIKLGKFGRRNIQESYFKVGIDSIDEYDHIAIGRPVQNDVMKNSKKPCQGIPDRAYLS